MQADDIIRVIDVQRMTNYQGEILNVYHFQIIGMVIPAPLQIYVSDFAAVFNTHLIQPIVQLQDGTIRHTEVRVYNLTDQTEQATHVWGTPIPGVNGSDGMPAQLSYSFKLLRYAAILRNGRKSISGVPDGAVLGNKNLNPSFAVSVDDVEEAMANVMISSLPDFSFTAQPIIVRIPSNPGVTPTVFTPVASAQFKGFGTQNSRKEL